MMEVLTLPVLVEGAAAEPQEAPPLTIAPGAALYVSWPTRRRLTVAELFAPGLELLYRYNAAGNVATGVWNGRITQAQPLVCGLVAVEGVWLYNSGAVTVVLSGATRNGAIYGWT